MRGKGKRAAQAVASVLCTAALYVIVMQAENRMVDSLISGKPEKTPEILRVTDELPEPVETDAEQRGESPQPRIFTLCDVDLEDDFLIYLQILCEDYGMDYATMVAMAEVESGFDPAAVGADGELGMWQIIPSTAEEAGEALGRRFDLLNQWDNAEAAVWLMAHYTEKYGDSIYALMAYSMGETGAKECMKNGATRSKYADCVLETAEKYNYRICTYERTDGDV